MVHQIFFEKDGPQSDLTFCVLEICWSANG